MSARQYFWSWIAEAVNGPYGLTDLVAFAVAVAVYVVIEVRPGFASRVPDTALLAPAGLFGVFSLIRLILAPYWLAKRAAAEHLAALQSKQEPLAAPQPEVDPLRERSGSKAHRRRAKRRKH